ncbi:ROK family protein [Propionimicrobium sp. PCR01-08-3]|uniref:ROK family transcriptional regulator n=1 Tax=Propionimicrobium sp. PCR01-08-3 TaxID=3052086 RepID=UPI00255CD56B|nr:ROK family protein [Propionimicrobium sp. PCR01-08-3]WIY83355.1 ROK family protein [Propionimicrobium sp. PCR01-08-3]
MKSSSIRKRTRRATYDFIRERGMATKNDIAVALGLSLPTVSKYLTHFMDEGLLEQRAKLSSGANGGRNPIGYACVADGRLAVGVDVTQDRVICLLVNLEREVLAQRETRREFEMTDDYYAFIGAEVEALLADSAVDRGKLLGVGVAVPGLISEATAQVTYGRVIDNQGLTAEDFGRHLGVHTLLVHDSDAAGLAEFWPDHGVDNAFYISLSKSVGGSVLINGRIFRGDGEFAGEIGHLRIHPGGKRCYCGQKGCMDAYCNAKVLASKAGGSLETFFARLGTGDQTTMQEWDDYTSDLAQAIHNIRVLFGCTIILGGDVGAHIGDHLAPLRQKVDQLSFLASHSENFLMPCSYATQPVATGAALYLVAEFRDELGPAQPQAPQVRRTKS